MSAISFDTTDDDLTLGDLTNDNFQTQILKLEEDELLAQDSELDTSMSPCILSSTTTKNDIPSTQINPTKLKYSPKGLAIESDEEKPKSSSSKSSSSKSSSSLPRQVYLVTYSKADVLKVQSREKFAEIVSS